MKHQENTDSLSVEKILIDGHVPPRPAKYIERKEIIQRIRDALYELKGKDEGYAALLIVASVYMTVAPSE